MMFVLLGTTVRVEALLLYPVPQLLGNTVKVVLMMILLIVILFVQRDTSVLADLRDQLPVLLNPGFSVLLAPL